MARIIVTANVVRRRAQELFERDKPGDQRSVTMLSEAERHRYFERAIKELDRKRAKHANRT